MLLKFIWVIKMDVWKCFDSHKLILRSYLNEVTEDNYEELLKKIYRYIKSVTPMYDLGYRMHDAYEFLREYSFYADEKFSNKRILDISIPFDIYECKDNIVEFIVHTTRKNLIDRHGIHYHYTNDLWNINFENDCRIAAEYVKKLCETYNVKCYMLSIYPGYENEIKLYKGSGFHYANIIQCNGQYYLIDCTYSQFFYTNRNNIDRLGVVNLQTCNVGTFMLMSEKGKKIAISLLQNGFVKLDEETFKIYLDAFTISFRNGLFYEETNDFSYISSYSFDDYMRFFEKKDNQINHEGQQNLGYQKRTLKNPNLHFEKRN